MIELRDPLDVLAETVDLAGRDVVDVGCGAGELVRWLRDQGARTVGVECGREMRARAVAADPEHADSYVDGVGQDLPFGNATLDVVIFAASLHHVPINEIPAALAEARRVLRPGGAVYVSEPAIDDPEDDVLHPLVDERDERAAAQAAIDAADSLGLRIATRFDFDREIVVPDFDEWLAVIVDIETARASALAAGRAEIRTKFERIGRRVDSGWVFRRRSRVALLRAVSAGEG